MSKHKQYTHLSLTSDIKQPEKQCEIAVISKYILKHSVNMKEVRVE